MMNGLKHGIAAAVVAMVLGGAAASAQQSVSSADIERLRSAVYDLSGDLGDLRARDPDLASRLQADLDELRDEVTYLRVKLRKEGSVRWSDYADVRDRIDRLRNRARSGSSSTSTDYRPGSSTTSGTYGSTSSSGRYGTSGTSGTTGTGGYNDTRTETRRAAPGEIPVGQELDVRLQTPLSSKTAQVEDRFEATTLVDLYQDDRLLVPAGSVLRGVVTNVERAGRLDRKASLTLAFDRMTVRGREYDLRASVTQALEGEGYRGDAAKIGVGAGVGAIIGGLLGGVKGAIAGILIGGGGTIAATEGKDVELPAGTVLRVRFDSPVTIR